MPRYLNKTWGPSILQETQYKRKEAAARGGAPQEGHRAPRLTASQQACA